MKKILFSILALALVSAACSTSNFTATVVPPTPTVVPSTPTFDIRQTDKALTQQAALVNPTTAPVNDTFTAAVESPIATDTTTVTPQPNLTTTPVTSTIGTTSSASFTSTLQAGDITLTPTLGVMTYGTLPPAVPFAKVTLINKSKAQAYISLQNYPANGNATILEYPVGKQIGIKAPLGNYIYVVWVGGRKITGSFVLHNNNDITITIYKDKVIVQ